VAAAGPTQQKPAVTHPPPPPPPPTTTTTVAPLLQLDIPPLLADVAPVSAASAGPGDHSADVALPALLALALLLASAGVTAEAVRRRLV
jgi:hypothetical protein